MKKILSVLLALAALLALATSAALAAEIALVTDVGTIDDESFNQACWEGVKAYAEANGKTYQYYQPGADSTDERLNSIDQAVSEGAKVIVCPGYLFGETVATAQELYPDVDIIAVDVSAGDLGGVDAQQNLYCAVFGEEQAGYLAGYAVVKDGYTKLGFLGGMAVPAVQRYGYGFVQGANAAAVELGTPITSPPRWKAGIPPAPRSYSPAAAASTPPRWKRLSRARRMWSALTLTSTTSAKRPSLRTATIRS